MLRKRWQRLLEGLWFVPAAIAVGFVALGLLLVYGSHHVVETSAAWTFDGDAPAARSLLSTIAGSLITVAGLTFSITILVLQLTASQLTPRASQIVFADRLTQVTIGVFVGTFVYCLLALQSVRDDAAAAGGFVPRVGVTVAMGLAVLAVALLIVFIHHVSQLVQVSHVSSRIARQTLASVDRLYPERFGEVEDGPDQRQLTYRRREPAGVVRPSRPGFLSAVGLDKLAGKLDGSETEIHVCVCPGDFVTEETPLALVWPAARLAELGDLQSAFVVTGERTLADDAMFGVRQLADIAIRALSPSLNDPTTAVTCIGYLQSILVRLAARPFPSPARRVGGALLVARVRQFDEYLAALLEVGRHALDDPRVAERAAEALTATGRAAVEAGERARGAEILAYAPMFAAPIGDEQRARELGLVLRAAERRSSTDKLEAAGPVSASARAGQTSPPR